MRSQIAIDVDVVRDHLAGRKAFGVAQTLFTPNRALNGITQPKQIPRETGLVIGIVEKTGLAGCFGQWTRVTANNRAAAGLCFNDRPTETFKARWIEQRDRAIIKRLEQFVSSVGHLRYAIGNSEAFHQRKLFRRQRVADEDKARVPLLFAKRENSERAISIFSAQIGTDMQDKRNVQIEVRNLCKAR